VLLPDLTENLPHRCILTEDPLRAKMLLSHHLEYAVPVYENGDVFVFTGSYNGSGITLISTGFAPPASFLGELKNFGVSGFLYISDCSSVSHPVRTVLLNGDGVLTTRAVQEAARIDVPVFVCDSFTAPFATELQERAASLGLAALSILTVSKNSESNEEIEEHERISRPYAASRLAFEVFGN